MVVSRVHHVLIPVVSNHYHLSALFLCMVEESDVIEPAQESKTKQLAKLRKAGGVAYAKAKQSIYCVFGKGKK